MTTTLTRSKTALKVHPAAEIFPMLNAEELDALALDIKANGLQQPIVMWEGLLLDGRNRLAACAICGVEPSFKQYEGNSPVTFVISANIKRRQLDASQRACVAVELEPMFAVEAKKKQEEAGKKYGRGQKVDANLRQPIRAKQASDHAAEVVSVSPRMVQYAKEIKVKNPEAFERIKAGGGLTVNKFIKEIKIENKTNKIAAKNIQEKNQSEELIQLKIKVKNGECWRLGKHYLYCGDCLDKSTWPKEIRNIEINSCITDPPYGIAYKPDWKKCDGSDSDFKMIHGDTESFNPKPFLSYKTVVLFGANYFCDKLPIGSWICWDKRITEMADTMFGSPFELAWFKTSLTNKRSIMVRVLHGGVVNADNNQPGKADPRFHPTQKPVLVMQEIIEKLTNAKDYVLDPFAGSGSTLLACEKLNRRCVAIEIDPQYALSILERWSALTGGKPERVSQ